MQRYKETDKQPVRGSACATEGWTGDKAASLQLRGRYVGSKQADDRQTAGRTETGRQMETNRTVAQFPFDLKAEWHSVLCVC